MNALSWIVDDSFSARLTLTLLHFLWQGCCVGLLVMIGELWLRRASARSRYALHVMSLLSMAACLPVTFLLVDVPVATSNRTLDTQLVLRTPETQPWVIEKPVEQVDSSVAVVAKANRTDAPGVNATPTSATGRPPEDSTNALPSFSSMLSTSTLSALSRWIALLYLGGVVCILGRLMLGVWGGHRLRKLAITIEDESLLASFRTLAHRVGLRVVPTLAWCEQISVPVVAGIVKPMILLPMAIVSDLTPDQLQALMLHELAHIRRFDPIINLLQRIIEAVLFFHPVVWFVSRRIRAERENIADDMVLAAGWERPHYADALVRVAELAAILSGRTALKNTTVLGAAGMNPSEFKLRVLRLLDASSPPKLAISHTSVLLVLFFISMGGVLAWSQTVNPKGPDSPREEQPMLNPAESKQDGDADGTRVLRKPTLLLPDHWVVMSVGFDNEGKELVTASTQSFATIRCWDLVGKKLISEIKLAGDMHGRTFQAETLTFSADRRRVIAATDAYVGIWETATGKLLTKLPIPKIGDNDTVRLLACTPDFSVVVGSLETNYTRLTLSYPAYSVVWDGATGKLLRTHTHENQKDFFAMSLTPDGKRLATTNGGVKVWDTTTGAQLLEVTNDNKGRVSPEAADGINNVWSIQFSPSGKQLAMGDVLGVKLLDAATGKVLRQLEGTYRYSSSRSPSLVFSADGQLLTRLGTRDKTDDYVAPIWSTQTGQKRFELVADVNAAEFSADKQTLAVGSSDLQQALTLWTLGGTADPARTEGPGPESRQDKVEENGHYQGKTAAEFIDKFKPIWSDAKLGIQYGIALTTPQRQFRVGERVPLVVFFRNASDRPLKIDTRPDFFGNTPRIVDAQGRAIELENLPLLGHIPHYVENLAPGEGVGPFYLSFGLGENPRPGKQHWHPFIIKPTPGEYQLTHRVTVNVGGQQDGDPGKPTEVVSGTVKFEIVKGEKPAAEKPADKTGDAVQPEGLRDEDVEAFALATVRTPFQDDPAQGSWQGGAHDAQVLLSLGKVRQQDQVVKALIKVVDRSEPSSIDQRRLAMIYLGGKAPQQVVPLLVKELEAAIQTPTEKFAPYHEIAVLGRIGEEARNAIPVLIKLLDFPDRLASEESLLALVKIGPSSTMVMNGIAKRFGEPDKEVWSRAVYEVARYGELAKPLGPTFIKLLDSKSKEAQAWAAQALVTSKYDEVRGLDVLLAKVTKGTTEDRTRVATALAALGSQASPVVDKLREFVSDPDQQVAKEVREAIQRIEKDDRIFTHAEVAAKTSALR